MTPLQITARLRGRVILPREGYIHLDGLLAWAVAQRGCLPPVLDGRELKPIEIPVKKSDCGRYHLCSASTCTVTERERKWINRRFPVREWQELGGGKSAQSVPISAGPSKGFRFPVDASWVRDGRLVWWCIGDAHAITELLGIVTHVGRKRSSGEGAVESWDVSPTEPWGDGFPVLGPDGEAMRHLPLDTPGLGAHVPYYGCITYPYWRKFAEELVAAPVVM